MALASVMRMALTVRSAFQLSNRLTEKLFCVLRNCLVIQILRVIRLREEVPALAEQAQILDDERDDESDSRRAGESRCEQCARQHESAEQEQPFHRSQRRVRSSMKEFSRVERIADEALRLL